MDVQSTNGGDPSRQRLEEDRFHRQGAISALAIAAIALVVFVVGVAAGELPWWLDALALVIAAGAFVAAVALRRRTRR